SSSSCLSRGPRRGSEMSLAVRDGRSSANCDFSISSTAPLTSPTSSSVSCSIQSTLLTNSGPYHADRSQISGGSAVSGGNDSITEAETLITVSEFPIAQTQFGEL